MALRRFVRSYAFFMLCLLFALGARVANASYILADEGETESTHHYVIDKSKSTLIQNGWLSIDPEQKPPTYSLSGEFDATLVHSWRSLVDTDRHDYYLVEYTWLRFANVALMGSPIPFDLRAAGGDGGDTTLLNSSYCGPAWPDTYISCFVNFSSWEAVSLQGSEIYLRGLTDSLYYQFAITANLVPEPSTLSLVCFACVAFLFRRDNKGRRLTRAV